MEVIDDWCYFQYQGHTLQLERKSDRFSSERFGLLWIVHMEIQNWPFDSWKTGECFDLICLMSRGLCSGVLNDLTRLTRRILSKFMVLVFLRKSFNVWNRSENQVQLLECSNWNRRCRNRVFKKDRFDTDLNGSKLWLTKYERIVVNLDFSFLS